MPLSPPTALGGSRPFLLLSFTFLFLPPTPNPLPSGKRALRFASPGFYHPPLLFTAFKPTFFY